MTDTHSEQAKYTAKGTTHCWNIIIGILTIGFLYLFFLTGTLEQQFSESKQHMREECDSLILKINHQEIELDSTLCTTCKQLHLKQKEMQKAMSDYTRITYPIYKENVRLHDQYSTFLTEYAIWTAILVAVITILTLIIGFLFKHDLQDSLKQMKEESKEQERVFKERWKNQEVERRKEWEEQEVKRRKELAELKSTLASEKHFNCIRSLTSVSPLLLSTPGMKYFLNSMLPEIMNSLTLLLDNNIAHRQDMTLLLINIHEMLILIDPLMAHDSDTDITHLIKARDLIRCAINQLNKNKNITEPELNQIKKELSNISLALNVEYDTDTRM